MKWSAEGASLNWVMAWRYNGAWVVKCPLIIETSVGSRASKSWLARVYPSQAWLGSAMTASSTTCNWLSIATMAEAITFGMKQGLAPDRFLEVISKCAGTSWMLENRAPHIVDGDYTPHSQVDIWLKDLGIVLDIARADKFSAPIAAAALQQYVAASGMGLGKEDDAAVAKVYARNSGIELPGE